MISLRTRAVYKVFVAALLLLNGWSQSQAQSLAERPLKPYGTLEVLFKSLATKHPTNLNSAAVLRQSPRDNQQTQNPTQDKSKADKARKAFAQAEKLRNKGSAESLQKAIEKYGEALVLYRALNDHSGEAGALNGVGLVYDDLGEKQKALEFYNQALPIYRTVGDRGGEATTLNNIGFVYDSIGEKQKALELYNQALPTRRAAEDRRGEATTLSNIGAVYDSLGEGQKALEFYNQALPLSKEVGDRGGEARTLTRIGLVYNLIGEVQKALDFYNQALPLCKAAGDRRREATTLNSIGAVYDSFGESQKALEFYNRALSLSRTVGDPGGEAKTLTNIGSVYDSLGEGQKALELYNQALPIFRTVGDRRSEASTLIGIGNVYYSHNEQQKALEFYNQAMPISSAVGDRRSKASTLNGIGNVYSFLGEVQKALEFYNQALLIFRAIAARRSEATTLSNIGGAYSSLGEMKKALEFYNQALPILRAARYRRGEAITLSSIGGVYYFLGQKQRALEFYNQVLLIFRTIGDRRREAGALTSIGGVYYSLGQKQRALEFYNQALPIFRTVGSRSGETRALTGIGNVYSSLGQNQKALEFYNQALPIERAVGDRHGEAATLTNIGVVYSHLGDGQKVVEFYNQALPIYRAVGDRGGEALILRNMMLRLKSGNPSLAIFYGKQAVNAVQQLRANIEGLDEELQHVFLHSKEDTYRRLADLLISEGRLAEAQQVLGLLKEEEFVEFVRRDAIPSSLNAARISFTPAEAGLEKRFSDIADHIAEIGAQRSALLALKDRTAEQEKRLSELEAQLQIANQVFQKFLEQLEAELKKTKPGNDVATLRESQTLKDTLRELDAVALYTIVGSDKYNVILITPDVEKAYEYKIDEADLNKKVFAFRQGLQDANSDPLQLAQELYGILIGPELAGDIAQTRTKTVLWSLDGTLRYLPVAALHDGQKYLVESYRNVVITLASRDHLKDPVSAKWQALGLGVSKGEVINLVGNSPIAFSPLPGVPEELSGVVRDETRGGEQKGVLPGKVMLDADFTAEAMQTALRLRGNDQPFKLVHIASHFNFEPGDETKSFLLLGGGRTLSLDQLKSMSQIFSKVELLTLSACNTATGGVGEGKEVEGFAVLAQRQGAEAIIASLWPVSDSSTSQLMRRFYRLRDEHPGMSKAEAMQQAQLALLRPEVKRTITDDNKRVIQSTFKVDPNAPFAHPYYWAPFILIGNWQ
jgi:CHAT domain-containing protein/Flp pilus assembly protein TadD